MGLFKRASEIVESQVNKLLDKLEDPNATLDLSYEKMVSGLQQVKRHLADVVTEQKALENQIRSTEKEIADREEEARAALKVGREDLAKKALELKQSAMAKLATLQDSLTKIETQVNRLKEAEQKFQERISNFKTEKEVTKATYTAAQAEVRMGESLSGISKELGNVGDTLRRANDKTERMVARAEAMQSLADEGILDDPLDNRDAVQKELDKIRKDASVSDELERLKAEMAEKKS
ncbi:PspA/IM30 family protein [Alicyclobacillus sp. TC]|uniref:Phage shock protein A n=2 Tax=Alicyclobacillus tolerans TaxID=90970 RepID=A0ABT9LVM2_9BACL|nr:MULTISPECIES: PspA/IM30 family protein [Alicyclobacillus]MDP9728311.1 phage shock protein A [Alicyclobacillus tengchongensis]QRF23893.1 PspA/IM30 family protein [Alicyclobacillus sp. TC]SHJ94990.1 phage shock protein A (PspA) family protein [Alicyclobacillus montanus]